MKIIATINGGFLIEATETEVCDLQRSMGKKDPRPVIGDILPAMDVTRQLRELREMSGSSDMRTLLNYYNSLGKTLNQFKAASERFNTTGGQS